MCQDYSKLNVGCFLRHSVHNVSKMQYDYEWCIESWKCCGVSRGLESGQPETCSIVCSGYCWATVPSVPWSVTLSWITCRQWLVNICWHYLTCSCVCLCVWISYFSQTVHLLEQDDSIYCISAWNDLVLSLHEYSLLLPSLYFHTVALPVCFGRVGDISMCMEWNCC